jgi:glucose uptake protein GlcU
MDWEVINGITGLISAMCAVVGIGYFSSYKSDENSSEESTLLSKEKLASFVIACSGWALCCLSYLWVFEPYGSFPRDEEYRHLFGVILGFPAVVILLYGSDLLINGANTDESS